MVRYWILYISLWISVGYCATSSSVSENRLTARLLESGDLRVTEEQMIYFESMDHLLMSTYVFARFPKRNAFI